MLSNKEQHGGQHRIICPSRSAVMSPTAPNSRQPALWHQSHAPTLPKLVKTQQRHPLLLPKQQPVRPRSQRLPNALLQSQKCRRRKAVRRRRTAKAARRPPSQRLTSHRRVHRPRRPRPEVPLEARRKPLFLLPRRRPARLRVPPKMMDRRKMISRS